MPPTGERMVPESSDPRTFWEHIYRYVFATRYVRGQRVLDVACGEGYGSAALKAAGASQVIGVDISEAACEHARQKYGLDARAGRAEKLPLPAASVDIIVSFETIEHVPDPNAFLDECCRVLVPGGRLIISTPNKDVYGHLEGDAPNPYHCSEMTEGDLMNALTPRFWPIRLFAQRALSTGWLSWQAVSTENSPWIKVRGFWRLRHALRRRFEPDSLTAPTDADRASILNLILERSQHHDNLLNPYRVRPKSKSNDQVLYLIAVAKLLPDGGR
jgi:ubiquinone/menaquinone biosynthesis C-methylase UbiE